MATNQLVSILLMIVLIQVHNIGLMQKYPPIFKKMFLNDVALLWMRGFHAYDTASVS